MMEWSRGSGIQRVYFLTKIPRFSYDLIDEHIGNSDILIDF
ncbi:hypothetical protein DOT_1231 [Desulfosporosinus sp. OT]|nr:hypothetical protein DOT_1231 [Desulfosporosinus sp. OT]